MHIKNHTQLAPNETSEQPCQVNTYLSVAVSSYTKLENASVGAGTVLIQREEFAEQTTLWDAKERTAIPGSCELSHLCQ